MKPIIQADLHTADFDLRLKGNRLSGIVAEGKDHGPVDLLAFLLPAEPLDQSEGEGKGGSCSEPSILDACPSWGCNTNLVHD